MDYAGLQSALATYSIRTDQTANWPLCIAMGEARLSRLLSVRQMVSTFSGNFNGATVALPDDFNGMKALRLQSGCFTKLEPVSVDEMDELKAVPDIAGEPYKYAIVGLNVEVYPEPATDTPFSAYYFANVPALSDENTTNWLLTQHPDAYLYASLVHFGIMAEDERLSAWEQALEEIVQEIEDNDRAAVSGDRLTPYTNSRHP